MPLDKFKQAGRPAFPDFSVSTGKRTYAFRQTGTIGNDPVIQIALANESTLLTLPIAETRGFLLRRP